MIVPDLVKAVTDGQKKATIEIQGKCFMNERIDELLLQAGTTGVRQVWFTRPEAKRLAELIVRECIDIVPWQYEEKIKKHFGVEE